MKSIQYSIALLAMMGFMSCSEYLDVKPDKKLTIPETTLDLKLVLQEVQNMNYVYAAGLGEIGSDNILLPFESWSSISSIEDRSVYVWEKHPVSLNYWANGYERILTTNTVIELLDEVVSDNDTDRKAILGTALFFRGYTFYDLVQVFAPAFDEETADADPGIVLRLSADINVASKRANVRQSYEQAISDLQSAVPLLPSGRQQYPTQPTKAAGYAALARCFLTMQRYEKAGSYADSCLQLHDAILDYNGIIPTPYPFEKFNEEVVFYAQLSGYGILNESRARIDTNLYSSYADHDLRKALYFRENNDGYFSFVGNYSQHSTVAKFSGITSAEMLLTRAEVAARNGNTGSALDDLNRFMLHRYKSDGLAEVREQDAEKLLDLILDERRKELVQRGMRWPDIRRLANESGRMVSLERSLGGSTYVMTAEQIRRFAYQLPQVVTERSGLD